MTAKTRSDRENAKLPFAKGNIEIDQYFCFSCLVNVVPPHYALDSPSKESAF